MKTPRGRQLLSRTLPQGKKSSQWATEKVDNNKTNIKTKTKPSNRGEAFCITLDLELRAELNQKSELK